MTIGNFWLGSVQFTEPVNAQNLATNSYNISTVAFSSPATFDYFLLNIGSPCTETLTISLTLAAGSSYRVTLLKQSTSGVTSLAYIPTRPINLAPGAMISANVSNGNLTGQVYGAFVMLA